MVKKFKIINYFSDSNEVKTSKKKIVSTPVNYAELTTV